MLYLLDLADVLRVAGLAVIEVPGWHSRTRRRGAYAQTPTHLMIHHTASPPSSNGQRDVDYIVAGSPDAPITNLYIDRGGIVWVCAAGATNTNGKGTDWWGGSVPTDRMNEYAISIEIANTGTGEPYPDAQQTAVVTTSAAVCARYGIPSHRVRGHFEWAPTRKIDPSGPSRWATVGKWDMDRFRVDVDAFLNPPAPLNPPREVDMYLIAHRAPSWPGRFVARVTADRIDHAQNDHAVEVDIRAGVPYLELDRGDLIAMLRDRGRAHVSRANGRVQVGQPFTGPYKDAELAVLWTG